MYSLERRRISLLSGGYPQCYLGRTHGNTPEPGRCHGTDRHRWNQSDSTDVRSCPGSTLSYNLACTANSCQANPPSSATADSGSTSSTGSTVLGSPYGAPLGTIDRPASPDHLFQPN